MRLEVHNRCSDFTGYRAARVKSLFNAESGCNFDLVADLPIDTGDWKIGIVVGPSGSGKTSLGKKVFGEESLYDPQWPGDAPIVEAIAPGGEFNDVTASLAAVGLGSVPSWLRPYPVLSNGEKFRANLARLICEAPARVVVDEFTSVVDRQIAKFGALAFQKAWRRTGGQCILLSCHYDILEWVEPDWIFDTASGKFARGDLQRPKFELEIWQTDWRYWDLFEAHHYLKLPKMIASTNYVGTVDGELVCHLAVSPRFQEGNSVRACRLVVMPEWQGAGVGMQFLNSVCDLQMKGENRWARTCSTLFHTSHPGLVAALRRDKKWVQVSASLYGGDGRKSGRSIAKSEAKRTGKKVAVNKGYGGHFRAVQGFRYVGERTQVC